MKKIILFLSMLCLSGSLFAALPVYKDWTPVELQDENGAVVVRGTVPASGQYYYKYHNDICFTTEYTDVTPDGTPIVVNGSKVYCYTP